MHDHLTISLFELSDRFSCDFEAIESLEELRWPRGQKVCHFAKLLSTSTKEKGGFYRCGTCRQDLA